MLKVSGLLDSTTKVIEKELNLDPDSYSLNMQRSS